MTLLRTLCLVVLAGSLVTSTGDAVAASPPPLLGADGPTKMRVVASGLNGSADYQRRKEDPGPIVDDGDRWVAWHAASPDPASTLLDTRTMLTRPVPGCRLGYGRRGLFVAACGTAVNARPFLYDAETGESRPVAGAQPDDLFFSIGKEWVAGDDLQRCDGPGCYMAYVFVNLRTGERRTRTPCFDGCSRGGHVAWDLDDPRLGRRAGHPAVTQGDLSIARRFGAPLVLRRRGHRPVRLARGSGRASGPCLNCGETLDARKVTWTNDRTLARSPVVVVHGYDADRRRRLAWTFRFRRDAGLRCRRYGGPVVTLHTRYAVLALVVDRIRRVLLPGGRCDGYPQSYTLHAARWPGEPIAAPTG